MKKISGLETYTVEMEAKIQIKDQTISNLKNENSTLEKQMKEQLSTVKGKAKLEIE